MNHIPRYHKGLLVWFAILVMAFVLFPKIMFFLSFCIFAIWIGALFTRNDKHDLP